MALYLAKGPAQKDSPINEVLEKKWVEQWLFYANSTRLASAMMGADYGAFANGRWYLSKNVEETGPKQELSYLQIAQAHKATYLLVGTVHEYRYKSDLSANPAVGITLRLVSVADGRTLWQGSSSKVGRAYSSLTSTAQKAVRDLASRIPPNVYSGASTP